MSSEKAQIIRQKLSKDPATYWPAFDVNGNGYLSLAELDKGIRDVLQLPELFNLKPVIIRAFNAAKTELKAKSKYGDDYVSKAEFKYLMEYLKEYTDYWIVFYEVDSSKDRRISLAEFQKAIPLLQEYGLKIPNAKKAFDEIDTNKGGFILFDEFCHWAITNQIDFEDDE